MVEASANSTCPDLDALERYSAGTLAAPIAQTVTEHIRTCQACSHTLEHLLAQEQLATRLREAAGTQQEAAVRRRLQQVLGDAYEVQEALGRGASGMIFKAHDRRLDRPVAVKVLEESRQGEPLAAALREAQHLARVAHPGVAAVYAVSEQSSPPYIVMEFVDGQPITEALADQPLARQVEKFRQVLQAAAELHRRGIVHRDLKPANVLVDRQGRAKLVDFGIAQEVGHSWGAWAEGTPAYVAPEQSLGQPPTPGADVFVLGIILFELLTGQRPFSGQTATQVVAAIREDDPPLPRSLREQIPGPLQAICLMALEKTPRLRYSSARQFLLDLERFLNGEAVTANPSLLSSVLEHGIGRHVSDLERWQKDRMISTRECDFFLDRYDRLRQREEFWVLDSRRISFSQVMLHLGAWCCVVSAFLMLAFPWPEVGAVRALLPAALLVGLLVSGELLWRRRTRRVALVLLLGAAILCPLAVATAASYWSWFGGGSRGEDVLPGVLTNHQFLAATASGFLLATALWWRTGTSAFALIWGLSEILLATAIFSLTGLRGHMQEGKYQTVAGWYLWPGLGLLALAMAWDLRLRVRQFAAPLYLMAVAILLICLTLIARFGPTLQWLGLIHLDQHADLGRQIKYSFMLNGGLYLLLGLWADRSASSRWLRRIGTLLFWLAPSHILIPILSLENEWPLLGSTWTAAELLLPFGALGFVFASVPKQMKSFFFSGLFYVAIAVARLTARHFEDVIAWPLALAAAGLLLAFVAWRYPRLFDAREKGGVEKVPDLLCEKTDVQRPGHFSDPGPSE